MQEKHLIGVRKDSSSPPALSSIKSDGGEGRGRGGYKIIRYEDTPYILSISSELSSVQRPRFNMRGRVRFPNRIRISLLTLTP
jgi:hypothetical protein